MTNYQSREISTELALHNYPLINDKKAVSATPKDRPVEDLIIDILSSHPDARYVKGIPIILTSQAIQYENLVQKAIKASVINQLGYILDITRHLLQAEHKEVPGGLELALNKLSGRRMHREQYIDPSWIDNSAYYQFSQRSPDEKGIKRLWKIITRLTLDEFHQTFAIYGKTTHQGNSY